jgi:flagellar motor protein MotB
MRCFATVAVGIGMSVLTGCKVLSTSEYDKLMEMKSAKESLENQARMLMKDKDRLTAELEQYRKRVGHLEDAAAVSGKMAENTAGVVKVLSETVEQLRDKNRALADELAKGRDAGAWPAGVDFVSGAEGVGIRIEGDMLFASGKHSLKPEAQKTLDQVVKAIRNRPGMIRVSGFTDSDPIRVTKQEYHSNFHLSAMRALSVLEYLQKAGIPAARMHIAGYGEHQLRRDGDKESKAKSRRAEIWLLNPQAAATVPQK